MKILHVITGLKVGGAESALYNFLAAAVPQRRAEHAVAYFHIGSNVEKIQALGVATYDLSGLILRYDPISLFKLKRLVQTFRPDILHTALWSANIIGRIFTMWHPIPLVCDLHGNSVDEGKFRNWVDRLTVAIPHRFVAVGDNVAQAFRRNIIDAASLKSGVVTGLQGEVYRKLVVIKNGIDVVTLHHQITNSRLTRADISIDEEVFVIGAVGRLEPIKSYDVLIKAFARFLQIKKDSKQAVLCIIGDGSQRKQLEQLAISLDIRKNVRFLGFRDNCYAWYRLFDCFALSSQSEGISIALLEAMAAGLPVVTTHQDKQHDVITHGVHGLLVPINNSNDYAQALYYIYENSNIAQNMKHANRELVANSFNIQRVVNSYYELYQQMLLTSR